MCHGVGNSGSCGIMEFQCCATCTNKYTRNVGLHCEIGEDMSIWVLNEAIRKIIRALGRGVDVLIHGCKDKGGYQSGALLCYVLSLFTGNTLSQMIDCWTFGSQVRAPGHSGNEIQCIVCVRCVIVIMYFV